LSFGFQEKVGTIKKRYPSVKIPFRRTFSYFNTSSQGGPPHKSNVSRKS
jgi:hypothetical protein